MAELYIVYVVKRQYYSNGRWDDIEDTIWVEANSEAEAIIAAKAKDDRIIRIAGAVTKREIEARKRARKEREREQKENDANAHFDYAKKAFESGDYETAREEFLDLNDSDVRWYLPQDRFSQLNSKIKESTYLLAKESYHQKDYVKAIRLFREIAGYKDSRRIFDAVSSAALDAAQKALESGDFQTARDYALEILVDIEPDERAEVRALLNEATYLLAKSKCDNNDYSAAVELFNEIVDYKDSKQLVCPAKQGQILRLTALKYLSDIAVSGEKIESAKTHIEKAEFEEAIKTLDAMPIQDYKDAAGLRKLAIDGICDAASKLCDSKELRRAKEKLNPIRDSAEAKAVYAKIKRKGQLIDIHENLPWAVLGISVILIVISVIVAASHIGIGDALTYSVAVVILAVVAAIVIANNDSALGKWITALILFAISLLWLLVISPLFY